MMRFTKNKKRMSLEKELGKKITQAEKNKEKLMKDQLKNLRAKFLAPVDIIKENMRNEQRNEAKNTVQMIMDLKDQDSKERERINQLK